MKPATPFTDALWDRYCNELKEGGQFALGPRDLIEHLERMEAAIIETLYANRHLADGDDCTLIDLKRAIKFEFPPDE